MWIDDTRITYGDFLDRFMSDVAAHTLRPKTIESYESIVRVHIKPELGNIKLSALTPAQLQSLYSKKLQGGYSKRTVQYIHAVIHKSLAQALKWGLLARNVAGPGLSAPRVTKKAPTVLTAAQAKRFLEVVRENRFYTLYVLAITTGMREGELLGLHWEDVDFDHSVIHVRHATQSLWKKGIIITEPKTEKARRTIALPEKAIEALRKHKQEQAQRSAAMPAEPLI